MNKKKQFVTPTVLKEVQIQLEKDLLQRSVLLDSTVTSVGQGSASYFGDVDPTSEDADIIIEW